MPAEYYQVNLNGAVVIAVEDGNVLASIKDILSALRRVDGVEELHFESKYSISALPLTKEVRYYPTTFNREYYKSEFGTGYNAEKVEEPELEGTAKDGVKEEAEKYADNLSSGAAD